VIIHTSGNAFKTLISMKEIEKKLPEKDFVRIHNSSIVRLDKIAFIKYPQLMVKDKMKLLQISNTYKENLFNKIKIIN
jgi:DNA-binding LytR/AlgR family response regulator